MKGLTAAMDERLLISRNRKQANLQNGRLIFLVVFFAFVIRFAPAEAMNWEGHDDWLTAETHAQILRENIAKARPLSKPLPLCAEREKSHVHNPYEQRPIAGVNCLEPDQDEPKSVR